MERKKVLEIERKARQLMDNGLYNLPKKLSIIYYYIFEDANFHTLNNELTRKGVFGEVKVTQYVNGTVYSPKSYGTPYAERLYRDYKKSGGRTWQL